MSHVTIAGRARPRSRLFVPVVIAALLASAAGLGTAASPAPVAAGTDHAASGFEFRKPYTHVTCPPLDPVAPAGISSHVRRGECVQLNFVVSNTPVGSGFAVRGDMVGPNGEAIASINAIRRGTTPDTWRLWIPTTGYPAGRITAAIKVAGVPAGEAYFYVNALAAEVIVPAATAPPYQPGEEIPVQGTIHKSYEIAGQFPPPDNAGVPATFSLQVRLPDGTVNGPYGPYTAASDGTFPAITLPAAATQDVQAGPETSFRAIVGIDVIDATYTDPVHGSYAGDPAGSGSVTIVDTPTVLLLENRFVSSRGWVKPGERYPFRVLVTNATVSTHTGIQVTIPAPPSARFMAVKPLGGAGTANIAANTVTWTIPSLAAGTEAGPTVATLVVEAKAHTYVQDPEVAWKDLSSTATLSYTGGTPVTSTSHGPKVIPASREFETARYGDKPFPMVPVDYTDRKHKPRNTGEKLSNVVNSAEVEGSTFNLYQEMSYGQLHPFGSVPSAGIASADFDYAPGFDFTSPGVDPENPQPLSCRGTTYGPVYEDVGGSPVYPERIHDGWYQLPGSTEYYGGDFPAFTAGAAGQRDNACGPRPKAVYDAATIADPEIDYNEFDSDKDGVVDFFMLVFVGCGGNGPSQLGPVGCGEYGTEPYDNIWPHSTSLEFFYEDDATGLTGYISDDQLMDLEGNPQCWTNATYSQSTDCASAGGTGNDSLPTYVRVGPYNVNPESAIDFASVISHEYGHYLGLPDFYSTYEVYADWNLMATDYSQHMTIFSKQELGWVVPEFVQPGQARNVTSWSEIKNDTGRIRWRTPNGDPYVLSAANGDQNIHNGQAYGVKLPKHLLIDPAKVAAQASAPDLIFSGRGDNFGCAPEKGHNIDIALPELADLAPGTAVSLTYKSSWDIEWDFDYGFTQVTTDGSSYTSLPSENGYTTPKTFNPQNISCLNRHDNGLTGQSGAYEQGEPIVTAARTNNEYTNGSPFLTDEYDLTEYAGQENVVLRFSYSTDAGFDRPGWFIDDLAVKAGTNVLYETDFSGDLNDLRVVNGGCNEASQTADTCTPGWNVIEADDESDKDHAYYLELRDRSGFDYDGRGQADRGSISWAPGVLIEYTDEILGYGNSGFPQPPRQAYLDSQPIEGTDCTAPNCVDNAFTAVAGDTHFDDDPTGGAEAGDWIDNFTDDSSDDGFWHFAYECLTLDVTSMSNPQDSDALPSDLTASATISAQAGCTRYDYGESTAVNAKPVAVAQARPMKVHIGEQVTLDGSASSDDRQVPERLTYHWDVNGDGTYDKTGMSVRHAYGRAGTFHAKLRVTDRNGLSSTDTVRIVVRAGMPDLDIIRHTQSRPAVRQGQKVSFTATIKNLGDAAARSSQTEWYLYGPDRVLASVVTPPIPAGATREVTFVWDTDGVAPGRYRLRSLADRYNVVHESNGDNNTWFFFMTVQSPG